MKKKPEPIEAIIEKASVKIFNKILDEMAKKDAQIAHWKKVAELMAEDMANELNNTKLWGEKVETTDIINYYTAKVRELKT